MDNEKYQEAGMTKRPKNLIQAVYLALLLVLVPGIALSQDQAEPAVPQQEKTAAEPAPQQPSSLITPGQEKQEPEEGPQKGVETITPPETPVEAKPKTPVEAQPMPAPEEPSYYVIKQGDTLWDISNTFMKDPFLWPFIWKANPNIANPDLIYPGNKLTIPSMAPIERAMQEPVKEPVVTKEIPKKEVVPPPAVEKTAVKEEPVPEMPAQRESIAAARATKPKPVQPEAEAPSPGSLLILPEERPVPIIDKYAMLSAGFVNQEEAADKIIAPLEDGKVNFSFNDSVYVNIRNQEQVKIGDKFLIYAEQNNVKHPRSGEYVGRLIRGLGILQITAKDSPTVLTARITLSFDAIDKNSLLTPYQEPALIYNQSGNKSKDISGFILEVTDERTVNSQADFVYLDKGRAEGVDPGDRFTVYAEHGDLPRINIGEVQVILVKEHTSTAFVRKSAQEVVKGNAVEFKK
jgi:LysM repeat protein